MDESYVPQVNDYVVWDKGEYGKDEGWVYFVSDEYITIETAVRPKPKCRYSVNEPHKFIHTLLLCYSHNWKELKYIKSREFADPQHYSECDN